MAKQVTTKKPRITNNRPLTAKQRAFVQHIVNNPKDSATQAVKAVYSDTTDATARNIASENLSKPNIVTELAKYNNMVENTIINTINRYKDSDKLPEVSLATDTARWVHDKIHGKATQQISTTSKVLSINIDLSTQDTDITEV